jgi:sugar phosphate permease
LLCAVLRDPPRPAPAAIVGAPPAEPRARFGQALAGLFASGYFILTVINWGMLGVISWTVFGWMPLFLQEHFHLGQGVAGISATFYSNIAAMPGLVIGGLWADRWSRSNRRARMLVPAVGVLLAAPSILLTATSRLLPLAILGVILYRLFSAFIDSNMMPILCEIVDRRYRATAYGLLNLTGVFGAGIGLFVAGALRDRQVDLGAVYVAVAAFTALGSVTFFVLRPRREMAGGPN